MHKTDQDEKGFIWIAHQEGLDRFDGIAFSQINKFKTDLRASANKDIRDIREDGVRKCMWALEGEQSLLKIDIETGIIVENIIVPKKGPNDWNICFYVTESKIWIGTLSGLKIYDIESKLFINVPPDPKFDDKSDDLTEIRCITQDRNKNIWVFTSGLGFRIFNANAVEIKFSIVIKNSNNNLTSCRVWGGCNFGNSVLLATDKGIRKIDYTNDYSICVNTTPCKNFDVINTRASYAIALLPNKNILVSSNGLLLFDSTIKFKSSITNSNEDNNEWLAQVKSISVNNNGLIMLSCMKGIMTLSNKSSPFTSFTFDETGSQKLNHVYSILPIKNIIYVATDNKLLLYNKTGVKKILDGASFQYILELPLNKIGIATNLGTTFETEKSLLRGYKTMKPIQNIFNSSVTLNDSINLLGTDDYKGIFVWNYLTDKTMRLNVKTPNGIFSNVVKSIYLDKEKNIWVLSNNVISLKKKNEDKFEKVQFSKGKEFLLYFDMCETKEYYWIAVHQKGILQIDKNFKFKRLFTERDNLCNNGVYKIFPVGDSVLFITTNNGLSVFNVTNYTFRNYYKSDGLHSNSFEEACGVMKNGKIYAGGIDGFTVIDPLKLRLNREAPLVYINGVSIKTERETNDSSNLSLKQVEIPNNVLQTTLHFSGINYCNPTRTIFAYKIQEINKKWNNIGTQNFLDLIGIYPGTYHFFLKSANEDGIWSDPKELTLIYLPKWYQTLSFKIAIVGGFILLLYIGYKYEQGQVAIQQQIRKDIASDLHDDIGSTLNTIKIFTHLLKQKKQSNIYLDNIEESITEATAGLRDMIWVLNDSGDTTFELVDRIKKFAIPVLSACEIKFIVQIHEIKNKNISKTEKRNLLLISKETINNSIKYAFPKNISLIIKEVNNKKVVTIKDDGKGFQNYNNKDGYGLKNIYIRAKQIGYTIQIISSPGQGTEVEVLQN